MRRLEGTENEWLSSVAVRALGGLSLSSGSSAGARVLFCRDTFDYPDLETHEHLCNHMAPKLKGRPRGRRKKRSTSPASESGSDGSISSHTKVSILRVHFKTGNYKS